MRSLTKGYNLDVNPFISMSLEGVWKMRMLEFMPASIAARRHTVRRGLREFGSVEIFAQKNDIPLHMEKGKLFLGCDGLDAWERKPLTRSIPVVRATPTPPVRTSPTAIKVFRNPLDVKRNYVVDTREITDTPTLPLYPIFPSPNRFEDEFGGF